MVRRPPGRSKSPAADRARRCRAMHADGLRFHGLWLDEKRFVAALRTAPNRLEHRDASKSEIDAQLAGVVEDFVTRWIGKRA